MKPRIHARDSQLRRDGPQPHTLTAREQKALLQVTGEEQADEHEAELLPAHQAAYPGVPFQTVSRTVVKEGRRQQRKQRYNANATMTEVVIEVLDERGELLVEVRQNPDGAVTSRREYEYDAQGDIVRAREYDGQGRQVDEYEAGD